MSVVDDYGNLVKPKPKGGIGSQVLSGAKTMAQKTGNGLTKGVAKLGKVGLVGGALAATPTTIGEGFAKDTQEYYDRYGIDSSSKTPLGGLFKDLGVRTVGMLHDLGDNMINNFSGDDSTEQEIQTTPDTPEAQKTDSYKANPIQVGGIGNIGLPPAPQYQGGIKVDNPNYQALVSQIQQAGQALNDNDQKNLGTRTHAPRRDWENEQQRKALLREATTVHKGAYGLTANQLRLAHDLSNDDIKLAQERHLQQNNLNHQLLQEQLQQQAQNQRAMLNEQGQMARAVMNEQGTNNRFNANLGLDVAKFNQDAQNTQYELGLKGADLRSRLQSQAMDDSVKQGHIDLYNQFINAKDDDERNKILTNLAVLTGRGGDDGGRYATMMDKDGNQVLYNTKTGEIKSPQQGNPNWDKDPTILKAIEQINKKGGTAEQIRLAYIQAGVPADQVDAVMGARYDHTKR